MTMLLDISGLPAAQAAYGLRKLRSAYAGSAIRVRRSSDNGEADIGFSGEDLDTTALLAHTGTGGTDAGYIVTWYDQTGNSLPVTQASASLQLRIVNAGAVEVNALGKPKALSYDSTSRGYDASTTFTTYTGSVVSAAAVFKIGAASYERVISCMAESGGDYSSTDGVALILRNSTNDQVGSYHNSALRAVVSADISGGALYAAGSRYDNDAVFGNRVQLHTAVSNDSSVSVTFGFDRITFGYQEATVPVIGNGGERYEGVVWTALLTDAQMASVLSNQDAYWITGALTETLVPTGDTGTPTNATGTFANVDEGVDTASDGNFISPTDSSLAMVKRLSYDPLTTGRTLVTGAGLQKVRVKAWKTPGTNATTLTVTIKEAGGSVLATPINAVGVTNESGEIIEGTFDASVLADNTAADIETEATTAPGSP